MPKIKYIEQNFRHSSLTLIRKCNAILEQYEEDGYDMTLRQLYYQLVAADEIPNKKESYDNLGILITNARLGGYIDWNLLVDRTRNLKGIGHYKNPQERLKLAAYGYAIDKWKDQPNRIEVWIEKDALAGVFQRVCNELDVDYFACRGYTSASEMWRAAMRFKEYEKNGQTPIILHFGDHDPSGLDMTRDIYDRLELFMGGMQVDRLALNMDQIEKFEPPPNYAKVTDRRFKAYQAQYGDESWELDALDPKTLSNMVRDAVKKFRNEDKWKAAVKQEKEDIQTMHDIADHYDKIQVFLNENSYKSKEDDEDEDEEKKFYCGGDENCYNMVDELGAICEDCKDRGYGEDEED